MAEQLENFDGVSAPAFPTTLTVKSGAFGTSTNRFQSSPNAGQLITDGALWGQTLLTGSTNATRFTSWFAFSSLDTFTGLFFGCRVSGSTLDTNDTGFVVQIKVGSLDTFQGLGLYARTAGNVYTAIGSPVAVQLASNTTGYRITIDCVESGTDTIVYVYVYDVNQAAVLGSDGSWTPCTSPPQTNGTACITQTVAHGTYNFAALNSFFSVTAYDALKVFFDDLDYLDLPLPTPPSGLAAVANLDTSYADLSWSTTVDAVDNQDILTDVYVASTSGGSFSTYATGVFGGTSTYPDVPPGLSGVTKYFKVKVYDGYGRTGGFSNEASYTYPSSSSSDTGSLSTGATRNRSRLHNRNRGN